MTLKTKVDIAGVVLVVVLVVVGCVFFNITPAQRPVQVVPFKWALIDGTQATTVDGPIDVYLRITFDDGRIYIFVSKHITEAKLYTAAIAKDLGLPNRCVEIVCAGRVTRLDVLSDEQGQTFIDDFLLQKGEE